MGAPSAVPACVGGFFLSPLWLELQARRFADQHRVALGGGSGADAVATAPSSSSSFSYLAVVAIVTSWNPTSRTGMLVFAQDVPLSNGLPGKTSQIAVREHLFRQPITTDAVVAAGAGRMRALGGMILAPQTAAVAHPSHSNHTATAVQRMPPTTLAPAVTPWRCGGSRFLATAPPPSIVFQLTGPKKDVPLGNIHKMGHQDSPCTLVPDAASTVETCGSATPADVPLDGATNVRFTAPSELCIGKRVGVLVDRETTVPKVVIAFESKDRAWEPSLVVLPLTMANDSLPGQFRAVVRAVSPNERFLLVEAADINGAGPSLAAEGASGSEGGGGGRRVMFISHLDASGATRPVPWSVPSVAQIVIARRHSGSPFVSVEGTWMGPSPPLLSRPVAMTRDAETMTGEEPQKGEAVEEEKHEARSPGAGEVATDGLAPIPTLVKTLGLRGPAVALASTQKPQYDQDAVKLAPGTQSAVMEGEEEAVKSEGAAASTLWQVAGGDAQRYAMLCQLRQHVASSARGMSSSPHRRQTRSPVTLVTRQLGTWTARGSVPIEALFHPGLKVRVTLHGALAFEDAFPPLLPALSRLQIDLCGAWDLASSVTLEVLDLDAGEKDITGDVVERACSTPSPGTSSPEKDRRRRGGGRRGVHDDHDHGAAGLLASRSADDVDGRASASPCAALFYAVVADDAVDDAEGFHDEVSPGRPQPAAAARAPRQLLLDAPASDYLDRPVWTAQLRCREFHGDADGTSVRFRLGCYHRDGHYVVLTSAPSMLRSDEVPSAIAQFLVAPPSSPQAVPSHACAAAATSANNNPSLTLGGSSKKGTRARTGGKKRIRSPLGGNGSVASPNSPTGSSAETPSGAPSSAAGAPTQPAVSSWLYWHRQFLGPLNFIGQRTLARLRRQVDFVANPALAWITGTSAAQETPLTSSAVAVKHSNSGQPTYQCDIDDDGATAAAASDDDDDDDTATVVLGEPGVHRGEAAGDKRPSVRRDPRSEGRVR